MRMMLSGILFIFVIGIHFNSNEACSILEDSHPQTLFCQAKFAVKVKVLKDMTGPMDDNDMFNFDQMRQYKVRVKKIFKDEPGQLNLGKGFLYTQSNGGMCGGWLKVGETYLVSGSFYDNKYTFSLFHWYSMWNRVTPFQKRSLKKGTYLKNCDCTIARCGDGHCEGDDMKADCQWAPGYRSDCFATDGACIKRNGVCGWKSRPKANCQFDIFHLGTPPMLIDDTGAFNKK